MNKICKYLRFLYHSSNEHGVHSPFVYNFITKCLYKKNKLQKGFEEVFFTSKEQQLLRKIFKYFNYSSYVIFPIKERIQVFDLLIVSQNTPCINTILPRMHNDSCLVILKSYLPENEYLLEEIKNNSNFTVSINCYHFSLAFIRKEQRKEHFTIRS